MFTLAISSLTTSNLPLFMDLTFQFPMQYCSLQCQTLLTPHSHTHNWVLFLLWACLFILSRVISLLISSSILGTSQSGEFIFQCPIFLPSHTVHGVLKARILKWFAIPFCSGLHFVRTLHHDVRDKVTLTELHVCLGPCSKDASVALKVLLCLQCWVLLAFPKRVIYRKHTIHPF